jgi:Dihydrouridine synthase (Dus)
MLTSGAVIFGDRERLLGFDLFERPVAFQLGGPDPRDVCPDCQDLGYDEINLKVGCPSDRMQTRAFGATAPADFPTSIPLEYIERRVVGSPVLQPRLDGDAAAHTTVGLLAIAEFNFQPLRLHLLRNFRHGGDLAAQIGLLLLKAGDLCTLPGERNPNAEDNQHQRADRNCRHDDEHPVRKQLRLPVEIDASALRFVNPRHRVVHRRAKSLARRIVDNGARAGEALTNLFAHGARSGLFGARTKLLGFRLKFLQNPAAILDQPRDMRDILRM